MAVAGALPLPVYTAIVVSQFFAHFKTKVGIIASTYSIDGRETSLNFTTQCTQLLQKLYSYTVNSLDSKVKWEQTKTLKRRQAYNNSYKVIIAM